MNNINISDIQKFYQFLDPNPQEVFTYCYLDDQSVNVIKGHGIKFGTLEEITASLPDFDFTLHTCLNRTKLNGRRTKDVESVRVLCVDLDTPTTTDQLKQYIESYDIELVVESSPGKYHLYWKIDPTTPIKDWSDIQLGLAEQFSGDFNLSQPGHTIRVPGVSRICKDGSEFMPRIVWSNELGIIPSASDYYKKWSWLREAVKTAQGKQKFKKERQKGEISRVIGQAGKSPGTDIDFETLAQEKERNPTLFSLCYSYALSVSDKSEITLKPAVLSIAYQLNDAFDRHHPNKGLEDSEIEKTVDSAIKRAQEKAAHESSKIEQIKENKPGNRPYTEFGLMDRVLDKFSNYMLRTGKLVYAFNRRTNLWSSQKGQRQIISGFVRECADDFIKEPGFEKLCTNKDGIVESSKFIKEQARWQSARVLGQIITATYESYDLPLFDIKDFDSNNRLFYCKNGVLDLIDGTIRPAEPTDYLLRQSTVNYDSSAECPYFINWLEETFCENENPQDMVLCIQEMFGYSLTGSNAEQVLFLHTGDGSNGKSRLLFALRLLTGDYCKLLQADTLTKNKNAIGKEIERVGAAIEGKRVVIIDDLETATQWNDQLVKTLTADTIVARFLYEEEKDIPNRAKVHIGCNEMPEVQSAGFAMFRRLYPIPYNRTFTPDATKIREIDTMIKRELSGILNWAIIGLHRYLENGAIRRPNEVLIRMQEYEAANEGAEALIPDFFEAPDPEDNPKDNWHDLAECTAYLRSCVLEHGFKQYSITPDKLGRILKNLKFENDRKGKARRTMYHVKLVKNRFSHL